MLTTRILRGPDRAEHEHGGSIDVVSDSPELEGALRLLIEKQAITEVLYTFSRAVDRQDIELFASVFHEDATDDHGCFSGPVAGFIEYVKQGWATGILASTNHVVTNILIELDGDVAHVESYYFAHHTWKARKETLDDLLGGRYLDRFERRNGVWKIASRRCAWDWGRSEPVTDDAWFRRVRGEYTFGEQGRGDPLYQRG